MAVLSTATASGKVFYANLVPNSATTLYTAPALTANVTGSSATAYIKEIILGNITASAVTVSLVVNGITIMSGLPIPANDTKILSGLNTFLSAGGTIIATAGTASALSAHISGVEVQ